MEGQRKRVVKIDTRIFHCMYCYRVMPITYNFAGSLEVTHSILLEHKFTCDNPMVMYTDKTMTMLLNEDMWDSIEHNDWMEVEW